MLSQRSITSQAFEMAPQPGLVKAKLIFFSIYLIDTERCIQEYFTFTAVVGSMA